MIAIVPDDDFELALTETDDNAGVEVVLVCENEDLLEEITAAVHRITDTESVVACLDRLHERGMIQRTSDEEVIEYYVPSHSCFPLLRMLFQLPNKARARKRRWPSRAK